MYHLKPHSLLIITGPTGVGKSDYALALAERLNGVIINADTGQFCTPLNIGTAKPDWRTSPIEHRLFDIIDEPFLYDVVQYRAAVSAEVARAHARGKIPLVVGGSQFYLLSLFFPPCAPVLDPATAPCIGTWDDLCTQDPQRAQSIHPHDTYRVQRALSLVSAGARASSYKPVFNPISEDFLIIELTRERTELYARTDARVLTMLSAGWLAEVASLSPAWRRYAKKFIGYPELLLEIESIKSTGVPESTSVLVSSQCIAHIQRSTRHYVKRQMTFWKSLARRIEEVAPGRTLSHNLTLQPFELYLERIDDGPPHARKIL